MKKATTNGTGFYGSDEFEMWLAALPVVRHHLWRGMLLQPTAEDIQNTKDLNK